MSNHLLALLLLLTMILGCDAWVNTRPNYYHRSADYESRITTTTTKYQNRKNHHPLMAIPASKDLEEDAASSSTSSSLMNIAASITQESCQLLGVKSLGVDYGLKRTGLAVSVGFEPNPLAILSDLNATETCQSVLHYAVTQQVQRIIVGLPLHKNGTIAEQTVLTLQFGQELVQTILSHLGPAVAVLFFDERYTSKEAAARAHSQNPNSALYGTLDSVAACIILENYYEDNGVGAQKIQLSESVQRESIESFEKRKLLEELQRVAILEENVAKRQRRKEARARMEEDDRAANESEESSSIKKRKKKKKKKK